MRSGRRRGPYGKACPRRIGRFLEPCLLLLLRSREVHGYELLEGLREFGFGENPVDSSTVYRMLRALEAGGQVISRWEVEGSGPPRRLYRLTHVGGQSLNAWVADLRETDKVLHHFLHVYDGHAAIEYLSSKKENSL